MFVQASHRQIFLWSTFNSAYFLADIDECQGDNKCSVNATCINTNGSYSCECSAGYMLLADQRTCDGELFISLSFVCIIPVIFFSDICLEADQNLFRKVLHNPQHVLHQLLPPVSASSHSYSLRTRSHSRQLPDRLSHLIDCNFVIRMLFYQSY